MVGFEGVVDDVLLCSGVHPLIGSESAHSVPPNESLASTPGPKADSATDPPISKPDQEQAESTTVTKMTLTSQTTEKVADDRDIIIAYVIRIYRHSPSSRVLTRVKSVMGPTGVGKTSVSQMADRIYLTLGLIFSILTSVHSITHSFVSKRWWAP